MADGLPSNTVYQVFQDSKDFIWFTTNDGVARYDGSHFDYYRKKDGLSSNEIVKIQEDSFGRLWLFNLNGTLNFFWNNTIYNSVNAPFLDSLTTKEFFHKFFQDTDKRIYFYYNHRGDIFALDSQNNIQKYLIPSTLRYDPDAKDSVDWMIIRYLTKEEGGTYTLWTQAGLFKMDNLSDKFSFSSDEFQITEVFPGKEQIFFSTAVEKSSSRKVILKFVHGILTDIMVPPLKMKSQLIRSILEDDNGFLWISTFEEGIFCLWNDKVIHHFDINEGQAIIQDKEKNIWISSMNDGAYKINPLLNLHQHYDKAIFGQSGITALASNPGGGIWCATEKRISLFRGDTFYWLEFLNEGGPFNQIQYLPNNTLLTGQKSSLFYAFRGIRVNASTRTISYHSWTLSPDPLKQIVLNPAKNEVNTIGFMRLVNYPSDQLFQLSSSINLKERIYYLFYNAENVLNINTKTNYIYRDNKLEINNELACLNHHTITDHLVINDTIELFNIEGDSLFLFTSGRLHNLTASFDHPIEFQIKHMVYNDPKLYLSTVNHIYICDNPLLILKGKKAFIQPVDLDFRNIHDILIQKGALYIASDDGLTMIPDTSLMDIQPSLPIPYFQAILVNDQETDREGNRMTLRGNNRINFSFSSKNYSSGPVIYSYMLEGMDKDWITGGGE